MLIRKAHRRLFTPSLRYLVPDEIHSYRGALATEIACVVRRHRKSTTFWAGAKWLTNG